MVKVNLKGVNAVRDAKGVVRYYAWRGKGAPRLKGEFGSPEFVASYYEAMQSTRRLERNSFAALVADYRASPDFLELRSSTQAEWQRFLDIIVAYFGKLPVKAFNQKQKAKIEIRRWRDQYRETPRKADYAMQVLSRVLSYAVEQGLLDGNPCTGIKKLYSSDRAEIVWNDAQIQSILAASHDWLCHTVRLAYLTGLRRSDLFKLRWADINDHSIAIATSKSERNKKAIVPIYPALAEALDLIPRRGPVVLSNTQGKPITASAFDSAWRRAKAAASLANEDLHFHDLRGTAVTRLYQAGFSVREIAEIVGWEEDSARKIIRRYTGPHAALLARLNESQIQSNFAK